MGRAGRWAVGLVLTVLGGVVAAPAEANAVATATARVAAGSTLHVRSGPSTAHPVVRKVANGSALAVACQVSGQSIAGRVRTSATWDKLADGGYVSDAYVLWPGGAGAGACSVAASASVASSLNLRSNASTLLASAGRVDAGAGLTISCQLGGEKVAGSSTTSTLWDRLSNGNFVADAFVQWPGGRPAVPWCALTAEAAPAKGEPFVNWAAGFARQMSSTYRVPASVIIAQAINESGWGRSGLTRDGNSYFGMKCFGSPGRIATGCRPYATHECANATCYATNASFRVYASAAESFRDHSNALATSKRYRNAFDHVNSPDQFATEIHQAGYATSPTYAQNIINLMRKYDLYRFDTPA